MSQQGNWTPAMQKFERRQVEMLIKMEGVEVSLSRPSAATKTSAGGYSRTGEVTVLPPKKRYIGPQGREQFAQVADMGEGAKLKQYLLGTYDDDIRQGDFFVNPIDGKTYTIEYVHYDRSVETRAEMSEIR